MKVLLARPRSPQVSLAFVPEQVAEYRLKLRDYSPVAVIILHQELGSLNGQVDRGTQKTDSPVSTWKGGRKAKPPLQKCQPSS